MNESMLTVLILGAELGSVVLLIFIVIVFFLMRRKRSDKQYVAEFITGYKKNLPARIDALKQKLESDYFIIGEDADEVLGKISDTETRLHKRILNLYLGNNRKCLADIGNDISSLNKEWLEIMNESLTNASEVLGKTEIIEKMQHDYTDLKKENEGMRAELVEAMKSMEEMLKEYSLLYAERNDKNENMERLADEYHDMKAKTRVHDKEK